MRSLRIPSDLNYVVNKMLKAPTNELANIVNLTLQSVNENDYQNINLQSIASTLGMNIQEVEDFFGVLLILIRWCQQIRFHNDKEIKNELIEQGFTGEWSNNFLNLIDKDNRITKCNYNLRLEKLHWRIDISLYNSTLKRNIPPSIIWNIVLSDGKQYTVEVSTKKFHELRFNISTLLKELGIIKNSSLVKK